MKTYQRFYLKIFSFLEVKFSIYLNRHVFVMLFKSYQDYGKVMMKASVQ